MAALTNGHYVVGSRNWSGLRGAATWVKGDQACALTSSARTRPGSALLLALLLLALGSLRRRC